MFWNIWLVIAMLSAFTWAGKRASKRGPSFNTFFLFIGEFLAFPLIVVFEEFTQ